ncbi:MAG TPA: peptide-methionine (S)-S-oxide reductase MsrA [Candidatus Acidoferrum sp.]|nr:peptide-methionine (S)-S-oxide reductase MsrA [Candidatus Acidoferrum sp.]
MKPVRRRKRQKPAGSTMMPSWVRFISFGMIAAALVVFAAFNSRAKAPRENSTFPKPAVDQPVAATKGKEVAVISGGCFWGIQAVYEHTKGVISATSGYAGGTADTAQYETVSSGKTAHAESVKVVFDPSEITYGQILMIFFSVAHNPTELNKQGPDWGTQYRSSIFYGSPEQKKIAEAYINQLNAARVYSTKIMTQVVPLNNAFYPAEGYHQDYLKHHTDNPYIVINDLPKIQNLKKQFPELYKEY